MAYENKITFKIDVKKLVKSGFYQGEKGLYATLTIVPTPNNQYGDDYMVTQYMGKKAEGERDPIVGNGRDLIFGDDNKEALSKKLKTLKVEPEESEEHPF